MKTNSKFIIAIIITSYPDKIDVIGEKGLITASKLKTFCPGITIIQFKGNLDR